jgi:hypothetical protein
MKTRLIYAVILAVVLAGGLVLKPMVVIPDGRCALLTPDDWFLWWWYECGKDGAGGGAGGAG